MIHAMHVVHDDVHDPLCSSSAIDSLWSLPYNKIEDYRITSADEEELRPIPCSFTENAVKQILVKVNF